MLRYPYFCKIYKEFLSCWLESGIFNLGIWPKKIHATTERCNEYEAQEQTDQTGAQELHRSQNGDFEAMTKLHIPVMVDEVVRCLAPQKGQGYMISCKNVNGETKFFQMSFLIRFYRTTLYLCLHYLCPGRLTFPSQIIWLPCPVASGWITQMGVTSWRSESEIFLDMTFGSGGHTRAILQKESDITLYALDRDPTAYAIAEQLSEFYPYPDMPTAADVVNALDQQALASILRTYGEEKHAKKIASAIVQARSLYPISRTQQLASIVAGAFPPSAIFARKDLLQRSTHIATKTFQAFRIFVNNELNELYIGLKTAQKFLRPGGRLVALSFHSLEDRIVKRFLLGISMTERFNLSARQKVIQASQLRSSYENKEGDSISRAPLMWELIHKKVLTPEDQDVQDNPRARSAKLRAAIKL
ncbi:12S rRNA N4-methylcytidine (m4C) methyltransferase isoform X2 [Leopardus geoffroyi]|uniref:12S rRNA N4-methylcytidine (m4C) methyltransferase isoform X2 n=1 Tax=Leopardus geoffroyi TaxID=46844 RepID=UPI001E262A40|nr:12S rRNA N4-methylcytidine (m4C) methyltransferase isoform X2 [Leopardus geoffroyi]